MGYHCLRIGLQTRSHRTPTVQWPLGRCVGFDAAVDRALQSTTSTFCKSNMQRDALNTALIRQNSTNLVFDNTTIRQTLRITTANSQARTQIRVRLSNAFGLVALPITSLAIANPTRSENQNLTGASTIDTTTLQHLTFSGNKSISIPAGALAVSDPFNFGGNASQILSISLHLASGQASQAITSHPGSRTTSWLSRGDYTSAVNFTDPSTTSVAHW